MNNETSQKKDSILKILAITGFIGVIIGIAWASIQLVSVVPSALASLAESVNDSSSADDEGREVDTLVVTSDTLLTDAGDPVTINWNTTQANGSYVFSYECADGVAIDLINETGLRSIQCGSNYNIGNVNSATISIDSAKNRYTDITYSVAFLGTNDTRPRAAGSAALTVLNGDISDEVVTLDDEQEKEADSDVISPEPEATTTPATTAEPVTPPEQTAPTAPPAPEYTQEFVYTIPTSNPNGKTDLAARYLFIGEIVSNRFVPGAIGEKQDGAMQFEVKNFGTKTSRNWSFTVSLPGGGTYESPTQTPLKPNERAILTIGFTGADTRSHTFTVTVGVAADSNRNNNDFSHRVTFVD
jgi:hypothetical protein